MEDRRTKLELIIESDDTIELMLACKVFENLLHSDLKQVNMAVCTLLLAQLLSNSCVREGTIGVRSGRPQRGGALCEDEERLRQSPPTLEDVQEYAVNVFKIYLKVNEQDNEAHETAQIRLLRYTVTEFGSVLKQTANEHLRKQLVTLLIDWTRGSAFHATLASAVFILQQPSCDLHNKLSAHLNAQQSIRPEQDRVLTAAEVSFNDGTEFTSNLNQRRLTCAAACFIAGMTYVKYLKDDSLQEEWNLQMLEHGCPGLERAKQWPYLLSVR